MDLHRIIHIWWIMRLNPKIEVASKAMPTIIMQYLSRRGNGIKHGGKVTFPELVWQVQDLIRNLIKVLHPWLKIEKENRPNIASIFRNYRLTLHYQSVILNFSQRNKMKCNTDMEYRGNLGIEDLAFYIRDEKGYHTYAKATDLGKLKI